MAYAAKAEMNRIQSLILQRHADEFVGYLFARIEQVTNPLGFRPFQQTFTKQIIRTINQPLRAYEAKIDQYEHKNGTERQS